MAELDKEITLVKKDFEDLGVVWAYQEYGGVCTIYGSFTEDPAKHALDPKRNKLGVSFDEDWHYITDGPEVSIYTRDPGKILFEGVVKNKEELIKILEDLGIRTEDN